MRIWNIPLGISTCRSATYTPHRTRWIRSASLANAFHESGRATIRHDTTTLGGGRYHPQGRRQVPRTLSRFAHVDPAQGAPRNRALSHGRTRRASRSMRSLWHQAISYNSCRNRHCPKCQTNAREKWLCARRRELLPVGYFHLVFSVPHALVPLMWQNKKLLFALLFYASAGTLLEVAADPARLGAEIGFLSLLHTWGQTLQRHPHIHCVVPGGGLSPDHSQWIRSPPHFFLPVRVLSRVFRGKFVAGLRRAFHAKQLA